MRMYLLHILLLFAQGYSNHISSNNNNNNYNNDNNDYITLPNSCLNEADGEHWLQLDIGNENYLPVHLYCSNEYVILDVNKDSDLIDYFSSWQKWHYAIGGPLNTNPVTWEEWFLPNTNTITNTNTNTNTNEEDSDSSSTSSSSSFLISPDCNVCDEESEIQVFEDKTSYWMTGNIAKIRWTVVGSYECDWNKDTYSCMDCNTCTATTCQPRVISNKATDYSMCGACGVAVQSSNRHIETNRNKAQMSTTSPHYKPSIGTDGRFCVCYKPSKKYSTQYSLTDIQQNKIETSIIEKETENNDNDNINVWPIEMAYHRLNGHEMITVQETEKTEETEEEKKEETEETEEKEDQSFELLTQTLSKRSKLLDKRATNIIELSQKDFIDGTYRIQESGTYILKENIEFDFNSENDYWPHGDQNIETQRYPGAGEYQGPYHMGFFAGITIESDYVTIDLNGFELRQSNKFFYKQRWFSIIELGNQMFLPGQGPSFFGANSINVESITIKNGILGLTSHFAIHGNFITRLTIENVHIKDFVTHGMQLNGWRDLYMDNVEVGPSCTIDYLKGDYGHGRLISLRLNDIIENELIPNGEEYNTIHFNQRESSSTLIDIKDELDLQIELAFMYAMNRIENKFGETDYIDPVYLETDEDKQRWIKTKDTFIHESGYPSPSSLTGLFLNFEGASVFTYAKYSNHPSKNGILKNIYIHDLIHDMSESLRIAQKSPGPKLYTTPFGNDFPAEGLFGSIERCIEFRGELVDSYGGDKNDEDIDISDYNYVGSVITDAYIGMGYFSDNWDYLGLLTLTQTDTDSNEAENEDENENEDDSIVLWATGESQAHRDWRFNCNQDTMFHSGKGLFGLRIDGIYDLTLDNIKISNIYDKTVFGTVACGSYEGASSSTGEGGHLRQETPMQSGFSGNNAQGISIISSENINIGNIMINNIQTDYGDSTGVSIWTANKLNINKESLISIRNIISGLQVEKDTLGYGDHPNRSPEACAFRVETDKSSTLFSTTITYDNDNTYHYNSEEYIGSDGSLNVIGCNINGHSPCIGVSRKGYTMHGTILSDDSSDICDNINTYQGLIDYFKENGFPSNEKSEEEAALDAAAEANIANGNLPPQSELGMSQAEKDAAVNSNGGPNSREGRGNAGINPNYLNDGQGLHVKENNANNANINANIINAVDDDIDKYGKEGVAEFGALVVIVVCALVLTAVVVAKHIESGCYENDRIKKRQRGYIDYNLVNEAIESDNVVDTGYGSIVVL